MSASDVSAIAKASRESTAAETGAGAAAPTASPDVAAPPAQAPAARPGAAERVARARAVIDAARGRSATQLERRQKERERDAVLVEQARGGDVKAFRALVEAHQSRLFAVAVGILRDRDDAMDVVQDCFIKAHKKLGEFEGSAAFSTWIYRITVNLCIDRKRAETRRRKADLDDAMARNLDGESIYADAGITPHLSGTNPLRNVSDRELGAQIGQAMAALSPDHRAIILLREVDGLSYEEIAEALGIPKGTVMSRLFHARKNLQRELRPFLGLHDGAGPTSGAPEEGAASDGASEADTPAGRGAKRALDPPPGEREESPAGGRR